MRTVYTHVLNIRYKIFHVKFYFVVKVFSYVFLVRKYFHNEIKANYGIRNSTVFTIAGVLSSTCKLRGEAASIARGLQSFARITVAATSFGETQDLYKTDKPVRPI